MKEIFALPMLKILAAFSQEAEKYLCFKKGKRLLAGMLPSYQDKIFLFFQKLSQMYA